MSDKSPFPSLEFRKIYGPTLEESTEKLTPRFDSMENSTVEVLIDRVGDEVELIVESWLLSVYRWLLSIINKLTCCVN